MNRFRATSCLALTALALMFLSPQVLAGEQVPFKGSLQGDVVHTPVAPTIDAVSITGTGQATHLGEYTVTVPHLVDRTARSAEGTYEFTAANGDILRAYFVGHATPTATAGVLSVVEIATITGGTGRFAGATGEFTTVRIYDSIAGTTTGSFEGTISSPGASKH